MSPVHQPKPCEPDECDDRPRRKPLPFDKFKVVVWAIAIGFCLAFWSMMILLVA